MLKLKLYRGARLQRIRLQAGFWAGALPPMVPGSPEYKSLISKGNSLPACTAMSIGTGPVARLGGSGPKRRRQGEAWYDPPVFAPPNNPAYAVRLCDILGSGDCGRRGRTGEIQENELAVAVRGDGDGLGWSGCSGPAWVLASPDELAGAGPGLRLPSLSGLRRQAVVR